jgi:hypothetical protein
MKEVPVSSALHRLSLRSRMLHSVLVGAGTCPVCGQSIFDDDHAIRIHNHRYHARCFLYRGSRPLTRVN